MSRLYLVEDHAIVREGLRALLEAAGHKVVGESAVPARALAEMMALATDVALIDLGLGDHSGLEVLAGIGARDLNVRALVLSMSAEPRHVAEALRMGARGYVLKSSPSRELLRAIDAVAGARHYLDPALAGLAALAPEANAAVEDPLAILSPRERQILLLVVRGRSSAEIGMQLHLSPKTIDTYRSRLMAKLGVTHVAALVQMAWRAGWLDMPG